MNEESLMDELQTIKSFIREGRNKLKDNGTHLIYWGLVIPVATLAAYVIGQKAGPHIHAYFWPITMGVAGVGAALIGRKQAKASKTKSFAQRISTLLWIGMILAMFIGIGANFIAGESTPLVMLRPICLLLGLAYWLHSSFLQLNWFRIFALGWWVLALTIGLFSWGYATWIMAGGTALFSLVPGILLQRAIKD